MTAAVPFRRTIQELAERISPQIGEPWHVWPYLRFVCDVIMIEMRRCPQGARLVLNAPPRFGKSLLISKWLPVWFLEVFPQLRVMLASYSAELASHWGRKVRDVFTSCPELWTKISDGSSAADRWETTERGGMLTAGIGGSWTGFGFHLGIIDDPCRNWQDAHSPTLRRHERDWFDSTFYTRREPGAHIIVLMQRWHQEDLTGYLTKHHADPWVHIALPAIAEVGDPLGRVVGEPLCAERFSLDELVAIKRAQGLKWNGLYQQRPLPSEGSIIKNEWLHYYERLPAEVLPFGISVDASFQKTEAGSFVVMQVWGRTRSDFYLLDQVRERMDFVDTVSRLQTLITRWPLARARWVERKANGAAILSVLQKSVPGLIPVEPQGSKEARLQAVAPFFEAGNVWLPQKAPWVGDYIAELTSFPSSENDDQVDATSQALQAMGSQGIIGADGGLLSANESRWSSDRWD